jgi:light-regulated signal transduction histidine kinase (bacteriophytochrome)
MSLSDRHIGALCTGSFGSESVRVPTAAQLDFFASMASDVALAFDRVQLTADRARALEDVQQLNTVLEQRVEARTAQLEASNREFEAFSYSVSHDLRAPLRHITGFAKIVQTEHGAGLSSDVHRYLSIIRDSAQNMGRMIDDLLEMGRLDRQLLTRTAVDLGEVVRDTIAALQLDTSDRHVEWHVGSLPVVHCDRGLVKLVFSNLLGNALKYTRPRATAVIGVAQSRPGVFVVSDNGVGFDQRYAHKLFGVFQRLHHGEEFEGTGIGLATVARIVQKHGGRIGAEGEVDRGASFSFTLDAQSDSGGPASAGGPAIDGGYTRSSEAS